MRMYSALLCQPPRKYKSRAKKTHPHRQILIADAGKTKNNTLRLYLKKYSPKHILLKVYQNITPACFNSHKPTQWVTILVPKSRRQEIVEQLKDLPDNLKKYKIDLITFNL